ncbi:MAG: hypothetical protein HY706_18345 [Candidatus Hydrogenedentes bacterium]|nr:hypothetical protein [Candidatus Hydrogenedentota bacterium]
MRSLFVSRREGLTLLELLVIIGLIVILAAILLPGLANDKPRNRFTCPNHLKQLGIICKMYAGEHTSAGLCPRIHGDETFGSASGAPGCKFIEDDFDYAPDMRAIYPEYLSDPLILVCPKAFGLRENHRSEWRGLSAAIGQIEDDGSGRCKYRGLITNADSSYIYFGWVVDKVEDTDPYLSDADASTLSLSSGGPAQIVALINYLQTGRGSPNPAKAYDEDIEVPKYLPPGSDLKNVGNGPAGDTLYRIREGVERLLTTETLNSPGAARRAQAKIPVLFDRTDHDPLAAPKRDQRVNVLYLDGHVEAVGGTGKFPVSKNFAGMTLALPPPHETP